MFGSPRPIIRKRFLSNAAPSDEHGGSRLNDQSTREIENAKFSHCLQLDDKLFETAQGSSFKAATQSMRTRQTLSTPAWEIENAKFLNSLQGDDDGSFETAQGSSSKVATQSMRTGETLSTPAREIENAKFLNNLQGDDGLFETVQNSSSSVVTRAIETRRTLFPPVLCSKRVVSQAIRPNQNEAKPSTWALRGASVLNQDTFFQPINQFSHEKTDALEEAIAQSAAQLESFQVVDVEDRDEKNDINLR